MPNLDLNQAVNSDYTNQVDAYAVNPQNTEGVTNQDETTYQSPKWTIWWGYFNQDSEIHNAITLKTSFVLGKGYTADTRTKVILDGIKGWGKDSFLDILRNMDIIRRVNGDSFAEIVRSDNGLLINLKPLDPSSIKIVVDRKGIIKRYEQINKLPNGTSTEIKFKPNEIFHLSNKRLADQIHGISDVAILEEMIKADKESFNDTKKLMHHQVKPFILWKLKTDDPTKISEIVSKINKTRNLGEDLFIPDDDDAVSYEIVQLQPSQAVFTWRDEIRNKFYRTASLPQVIAGAGGQGTESDSKVIYLGFEGLVESDQLYIETQVKMQLGLTITLYPPASLQANLQTDTSKDGALGFQPSEVAQGTA